tara:strand:+ start:1126 stop:2064 length:939 start_codon:yes stop_codon:yes gene_type:complete
MKIDPLSILLNKDFILNKKFYFISGNELSFIQHIKTVIIEKFQNNEEITLININTINDFIDEPGLFENKKIYLVENSKEVEAKSLNKLQNNDGVFIFVQENSPKIKRVKKIFEVDKHSYLIDCYDLDKNSKIKILNEFLRLFKINIDQDIYWFLIEKLDNKYVFLENSLNKIFKLDQKEITLSNIKKLLTIDESGKEKIFFNLLKKNKEIVGVYREKILTPSDVNDFYYYCKFLCYLIIDCKDVDEYRKKIPVYLFREKNFLIDIYKRYNSKKKKLLLNLLFSTERMLRKESDLSLVSGLRFLLNLKKITIF